MTAAVYGLLSGNANVAGPYSTAHNDISDISSLVSPNTYYVLGFISGEQKAKFFYNSYGAGPSGQALLPTLSTPNALPQGAVFTNGATATSYVYAVTALGYNPPWGTPTTAQGGELYFNVTFAAGNPDSGSPSQFSMDVYGLLIISTTNSTEWV